MSSKIESLSNAMADFAVNLYKKAGEEAGKEESIFLSPFSVACALAMTYAGADGKTKQQMKDVLFGTTDLSDEAIHDGFSEIMTILNNPQEAKLLLANRLYANQTFAHDMILQYLDLLKKKYQSEMELTNFQEQNGEVARQKINSWVSEKTNEKIPNIIPSGLLKESTRFVLVNAIYFKGDWSSQFSEEDTVDNPFYASQGKELTVRLMRKYEQKFAYGETEEYQLLGMPYKGNELKMFIFLPKDRYGLEKLEQNMTGKKILEAISDTTNLQTEIVAIPKFKLQQRFSLSGALKSLGAADMFQESVADFSNISGKKNLYVSEVVHQAFIEVNEKGTEAAAATAVAINVMCMPPTPDHPIKFVADHSFMYVIYDKRFQSILFIGKFTGKGEN